MNLAEGQVRVLEDQLLGAPAVRLHVGDQLNDLRVGGPDPGNALLVQGDVLVGGRRSCDHGIFPSAAILAPAAPPSPLPAWFRPQAARLILRQPTDSPGE